MSSEAQTPGLAAITFLTGPPAGKTFRITKPITTIGREANNDLVVKGDLKVSRQHARLRLSNGAWSIENLSENNKLIMNQESVRQAVLQDGSVIGLGEETTFRFSITVPGAAEEPTGE